MDTPQEVINELSPIAEWLLGHGVRILIIITLAVVVYRLFCLGANRVKRHVQARDGEEGSALDKRADTLFGVLTNAGLAVIATAATLMVLQELDIEIGPLLASVGIAGLALGLGAQTLVADVISGLFVLLENQYRVGDSIEVNSIIGTVEQMTLRVTSIRDVEGVLHYVPNGEIRTVANRSRDWSRAIVDVGIAYEVDVGRAMATLEDIVAEMIDDPAVQPLILEEPQVIGIEGLEDWQVRLRVMVRTLPGQHFEVQRYLRRRIRRVFYERGLELASPRQEIIIKQQGNGDGQDGNRAAEPIASDEGAL